MTLKLLHTSDWHLGQTFYGYDRDAEHDAFLKWLVLTLVEQQTDVLLIAGDIFDVANPSASAQHRFFRFLKEAKAACPQLQIIITAGNHDSAARLEAPLPLLEELNTTITGMVRRTGNGDIDYDALLCPIYNKEGIACGVCLTVPYLRQGDYPPAEEGEDGFMAGVTRLYRKLTAYAKTKTDGAIVAMGHMYAGSAELSENDRSERVMLGGLESIPADVFDTCLAYTALGHIHKAQRIGARDEVRYSGSPLPMSFTENRYKHQVVAVTIEDSRAVEILPVPIPVSVELLRIPDSPQSPEKVLDELSALPDKTGFETDNYPYVEVRVLLTEPVPEFRHQVEEILKDKAVRLTSIVGSYTRGKDLERNNPLTFSDLQSIAPLTMLEHAFAVKYGADVPDAIKEMFNEVVREVSL